MARASKPPRRPAARTPLSAVALSAVAAAVALILAWWLLGERERAAIANRTAEQADHAARRLHDFVAARLVAVDALGRMREAGLLDREDDFVASATIVQTELGGYLAINWVAEDGTITWVSPPHRNAAAKGKNVFSRAQAAPALRAAQQSGRPQATQPLELFQGMRGFATYYPVRSGGVTSGYVNGVFDLASLVTTSLGPRLLEDYDARLDHASGSVYETAGFASNRERVGQAGLTILGQRYDLALVPRPEAVPGDVGRHVFVGVGLLLTLVCSALAQGVLRRRRRQGELERERGELAELVSVSPDLHALLGREGHLLRGNDAALAWCPVGSSVSAQVVEADRWREAFEHALAGEPQRLQLRMGPDRHMHDVTLTPGLGAGEAVVMHARDDRERIQLETNLRRAQKMEAVGRLAGGIAHDFNNLLTAVHGLAHLASVDDRLPPDMVEDMTTIVDATNRGANLTEKLLTMARLEIVEDGAGVEAGAALQSMNRLLRQLVREDTELIVEQTEGPLWVPLSPSQLEQVVLNLVMNAIDALGEQTERTGEIRIALAEHDTDTVGLAVEDNGPGIEPDVAERIFEPFFTTKPRGKGTGLGLASVFGIVKASGGELLLDTELGRGTRIELLLPRSKAPEVAASTPDEPTPPSAMSFVLLVEDQPEVRKTVRRLLEHRGYAVIEAENGRDALDVVEKGGVIPDLLLSDVIMPEMSGPELAQHMRDRFPDIAIVLCSGYTGDALRDVDLDALGAEMVTKPFEAAVLFDAAERALAERRS